MESTVASPANLPLGALRRIRVLLIEDDPEHAALTCAHIRDHDDSPFHIEWESNMLNAISRLSKPGIDVVLLDLGMEDLSGYKTHLAITSVAKHTPVVIYTADDSAISHDLTMGAFRYLVKGRTHPVELRQALHEAALSAPL